MNTHKKSPISLLGIIVWSIAASFFLYEFFLRTFVGSLAHQIIPDLKLNPETFSIIGSAYYAAYGIMQIPVGMLADKFGVKKIMMFATLVCSAATFLFAHATGFTSAFVSRLLMGFGSSFAFVCLLIVAITWFPKRFFGFFAGLSQFVGTMGPVLAGGPLIALIAASHQTWRFTLTQVGFFGLVLTALIFFIVKNQPKNTGELIYLKREEPLKKLMFRLFKNKQAWFIAIYSASSYIPMPLMGAIWGTEYLEVRHLSQVVAAEIISLTWLGYAIGCPLFGALSDIAKRRKPMLVFCALLGLLASGIIIYTNFNGNVLAYSFLFFCLGLSSSAQNIGFATITEHVDIRTRATALGLNNGMIALTSSTTPLIASYFIMKSAGEGVATLTAKDFTLGFSMMPVLFVIASICAMFFIKETYCKPQKEAIRLSPQAH